MDSLIYIFGAIVWYGAGELAPSRTRSKANVPTQATFWIGITQSIGSYSLTVAGAVSYLIARH
jgi:hypothetical protein